MLGQIRSVFIQRIKNKHGRTILLRTEPDSGQTLDGAFQNY